MSDNREFIRTTSLKGMRPAQIRNSDAIDAYPATIAELRKICAFALNRKTEVRSPSRSGSIKAAKEPARSAKSKPAEKAPAKADKKRPPARPAKEPPRSGGARGDKRRGTK